MQRSPNSQSAELHQLLDIADNTESQSFPLTQILWGESTEEIPREIFVRDTSQSLADEETNFSQTQSSDWITSAQRVGTGVQTSSLSAPSSFSARFRNVSSQNSASRQSQRVPSRQPADSFPRWISLLFPLLVRLVLANTHTMKIQCLLEFSSLFHAETTGSSLLLSSATSLFHPRNKHAYFTVEYTQFSTQS